jgi:hypothetical protein
MDPPVTPVAPTIAILAILFAVCDVQLYDGSVWKLEVFNTL